MNNNMEFSCAKILNMIKGWSPGEVMDFLRKNNLNEYIPFAESKNLNGFTLLMLSEGIIAMWRPKVDSKKIVKLIEDLKVNPQNYFDIASNTIIDRSNSVDLNNKDNATSVDTEIVVVKRLKPKVPKRVDSLIKENKIEPIDHFVKHSNSTEEENRNNTREKKLSVKFDEANEPKRTDENVINLENIVAPKSFLYSDKLINAMSKLCPYLPMKMTRDDVVLRKKTPFSFNETDSKIFQDAGYYEMTTRKSLNYGRRHSDSTLHADSNPYEELLFKNKLNEKYDFRKRLALLKRVLCNPTFKRDRGRNNNTEECPTNIKRNSNNIGHNGGALRRINEMVVKRFYPKITSNYKIKKASKNNNRQTSEKSVKTEKFKQFNDNNEKAEKIVGEDDKNSKITSTENSLENLQSLRTNSVVYEEENLDNMDNVIDDMANEHLYEEAEPNFNIDDEDIIDVKDCTFPIQVEDYLEPIQCKFNPLQIHGSETVMDNLADEIIKMFDENMAATEIFQDIQPTQTKEEYLENQNQPIDTMIKNPQTPIPVARLQKPKVPVRNNKKNTTIQQLNRNKESIVEENSGIEDSDNDRPFDTLHKWNESLKNSAKRKKEAVRRSMIDRPLPVPVENEFYYMEVGRKEAEELLEGHADGTFILRPSSQSSHIYTVTLIYRGHVYNIGCRRRADGRLALGFSKAGEQSFLTIDQLIQHYYTERLLLIQDGVKVGSTTLRKLDGN